MYWVCLGNGNSQSMPFNVLTSATNTSIPYLDSIAIDSSDNIYFYDPVNCVIRKVSQNSIFNFAGIVCFIQKKCHLFFFNI